MTIKRLQQLVVFVLALSSGIILRGADYFGVQFTDEELKQYHAGIAARYGIAGETMILYGRDAITIRGNVLAVLNTDAVLVQPPNGEPVVLKSEADLSKIKTGTPVNRLGLRQGESDYAVANGGTRKAARYIEIRMFEYDRFLESLSREPQHPAFDGMRIVAESRLMTIRALEASAKTEEDRQRKEGDPRWQKRHLMKRGGQSVIKPRTPIADDSRTLK